MEEREREEEEWWWSWGAGTEGQLGTGRLQDEHVPQRLPPHALSSVRPFSHLACGGAHVIALTTDGRVLTWGRGTSGQLGLGELGNSLQPKAVKLPEGVAISCVSAGWNHSGFVSDTGRLFTCGDGSFGQLGHEDYQSQGYPVEVVYFGSKHVVQIACGMRHSVVLLKDAGRTGDLVYGFGAGKRGQLGISSNSIRSVNLPQVILGLEEVDIVGIAANGDHSAALSADGNLYTWGRGFSRSPDSYLPRRFRSPLRFSVVALGWNHALLLTFDKEVYILGGMHLGTLGDLQKINLERCSTVHQTPCTSSDVSMESMLEKVPGLDGMKVAQIAAGSEHSAVVTESGVLLTWGWGEHGQLGLGNTCDRTCPQPVNLGNEIPFKHTTFNVYCGSGFTYAIKTGCLSFGT